MSKIGIFYGSTTGNTQNVAEQIMLELDNKDIIIGNISEVSTSDIENCDNLILGISTWGYGDLQDDWDTSLHIMDNMDLSGKKVAIFGLGDQQNYPDTFVDAMAVIYEKVISLDANVVGFTSGEDYSFNVSKALTHGKFIGLVIDEDNEAEKTEERISDWVKTIKLEFGI